MHSQTPNYEDRVVCFIDILGFRHLISKTVDKNGNGVTSEIAKILDAFRVIRRLLDMEEEAPISDGVKITHFSDSIVISFPITAKSGVFYTLIHLLWVQMNLINRGIPVRGAITIGKIIHTDIEIFGPGMNAAYDLERKVAIYPRIILGEEIIKAGIDSPFPNNLPHHEETSIRSLLHQDTDGMYYLDYFGPPAFAELDEPIYDAHEYLQNIKNSIEEGLKAKDASVLIKYQWMKQRYNASLNAIEQGLKNATEIDPDVINAYSDLGLVA